MRAKDLMCIIIYDRRSENMQFLIILAMVVCFNGLNGGSFVFAIVVHMCLNFICRLFFEE